MGRLNKTNGECFDKLLDKWWKKLGLGIFWLFFAMLLKALLQEFIPFFNNNINYLFIFVLGVIISLVIWLVVSQLRSRKVKWIILCDCVIT